MNDDLSAKSNGVSLNDLRTIANSMERYMETNNEETIGQVAEVLKNNSGFWASLFPTDLEKEQNRAAVERLRSLYKAKEQFFKLYTDIKLEIVKKQGEALIASVGMDLQTKLAAFATAKIDELTQTIDESRSRFMKRMRPQLEELETYQDVPVLYEPARESVNQEIKIYFQSINKLLNGFINALESKVSASK